MKVKLTLKQRTELETIECSNVKYITFDKQYLIVAYNKVNENKSTLHSYYKLNTVLAVEEK